jgi:exopolyphosphatase/guanosine-5'-triphosphate,3'-diphosphate pyrophosphatase
MSTLLTDSIQPCSVVDIGSNSIRLVIFDTSAGYPHPVYNERIFCALGEGVGRCGHLCDNAIDDALTAVVRFARVVHEVDAGPLHVFATSAVRDAANGSILTEAVHSRTGSEVDVISGTDEARLSADAVRYGLNLEDGVVADLGGGSLELALIKKGEISQTASLPLGTVRLTARMDGEMSRMQGEIIKYVDTVSWLKKSHAQFLVPLGGAFRNFAQLNIAENRHPLNIIHGYTASPSVIQNRIDLLAGMSTRSLSTLSGIAARRRRSLPLTSVILAELMQRSAPSTIAFAAVGVREGYVFSRMSSKTIADDPLTAGARAISLRDSRYGDTSGVFMDWLTPLLPRKKKARTRLQRSVCALADMAWREHPDYRATYAFERSIQYPFLGISHTERAFIALSLYLRYGGKPQDEIVTAYNSLLSKRAIRRAEVLGLALRLAYRISGGSPTLLMQSSLVINDGRLSVMLPPNGAAPRNSRIISTIKLLCAARNLKPGAVRAVRNPGD